VLYSEGSLVHCAVLSTLRFTHRVSQYIALYSWFAQYIALYSVGRHVHCAVLMGRPVHCAVLRVAQYIALYTAVRTQFIAQCIALK
jgi:hypothetical protein